MKLRLKDAQSVRVQNRVKEKQIEEWKKAGVVTSDVAEGSVLTRRMPWVRRMPWGRRPIVCKYISTSGCGSQSAAQCVYRLSPSPIRQLSTSNG
jgi:hypothetical protein